MAHRVNQAADRKRTLAHAAIATIMPGEFIYLDSGSSNLAVANCLPSGYNLTVATKSIGIAAAICGRDDVELIIIGGRHDVVIGGCVDASAVMHHHLLPQRDR
jgi:DeoR/GlpR family transcriptional regulator of sugar metabolism